MILKAKRNRAIVLTTHFMDEADLLSDRIGIMKAGQVYALGTPLFLKNRFGGDYTLTCKSREHQKEIQKIVLDRIPEAKMSSSGQLANTEDIIFQIPTNCETHFPFILKSIQGLTTDFSLGMTTMEEVFIRSSESESSVDSPESVESKSGACSLMY